MRRIIKVCLYPVMVMLLLLIGLYWMINLPSAQPAIGFGIKQILRIYSGIELDVDGFSGNWLGHFKIDKLKLMREGKPILNATQLETKLKLGSSLKARRPIVTMLSIETIELKQPKTKDNKQAAFDINALNSGLKQYRTILYSALKPVETIHIGSFKTNDISLALDCHDKPSILKCELHLNKNKIDLNFNKKRLMLVASGNSFSLDSLSVKSGKNLQGKLNFDLKVDLSHATIDGRLRGEQIISDDIKKPLSFDLGAAIRNEKIMGALTVFNPERNEILKLRLDNKKILHFSVDLASMNYLPSLEPYRANGMLTGQFQLTKNYGLTKGDFKLVKGKAFVDPLGELNDIELSGVLDGGRLRIVSLTAKQADNQFISISAKMNLATFDIEATAKIDALKLVLPEGYRAVVDANLHFQKIKGLSGNINVLSLDKIGASYVSADIPTLHIVERAKPKPTLKQSSEINFPIDLVIKTVSPVRIADRGIVLKASANLKIQGSNQNPSADGVVMLEKTIVDFLNHRFTMENSRIDIKANRVYMRLRLTTEIPDHVVVISIQGNPEKPKLIFTSTPALPENEILSRLIFDTSVNKLSPMQLVQLMKLLSSFSQGQFSGNTDFIGQLGQLMRLDSLVVGYLPESGVSLGAKKRLTDKLSVSVDKSLAAPGTQAKVEVKLNSRLTLEGDVNTEDNSPTLRLNWKYDY